MDKLVFIPPAIVFLAGLLWAGFGVQHDEEGVITLRTEIPENVRTSPAGADTVNSGTVIDLVLTLNDGSPESNAVFWLVQGPADTLGFHTKEPSLRLSRLGTYRVTAFEHQRVITTSEIAVVEGRKVMAETGPTELRAGQTFTAADRSNFAAANKRWLVVDDNDRIVTEEENVDEFSWKVRSAGNYQVALIYLDEQGNEISRNTTPVNVLAPPKPARNPAASAPAGKPAPSRNVVLSMAATALSFYYDASDPANEPAFLMQPTFTAVIQPSEELQINHFIAYLKAGKYDLLVFKNGKQAFEERANLGSDRAWEFGLSKLGRITEKDRIELKLTVTKGSVFTRSGSVAKSKSDYFMIDFDGGHQWIFNVDMNVQGQ